MLPVFPLGVKKDVVVEPHAKVPPPSFDAERLTGLVGASAEKPPRFAKGFPEHLGGKRRRAQARGRGRRRRPDGCNAHRAGRHRRGLRRDAHPELRAGVARRHVLRRRPRRARTRSSRRPRRTRRILVAFNAPSLAKFAPDVVPGGTIVYDSSVIHDVPKVADGVRVVGVPFTEIAVDLGKAMVKNVVALGALCAATRIFPEESFKTALRQALKDKCALIPLNEEAFAWGVKSVAAPGH